MVKNYMMGLLKTRAVLRELNNADLLIELLSEEIPARMQRKASSDLEQLFTEGISELGLTYKSSASFSTPRRLTLVLENVSSKSLSRVKEEGP